MDLENLQQLRDTEIQYCVDNPVYFVETYGHYEDKDADELIQPFKMWKEQKDTLLSLMHHRLNVVLKARQLGITWIVLHIAAHLVGLQEGKTVIGISKNEDDAKELARRLAVVFRYMPELIAEKDFEPPNWNGAVFKELALTVEVTFPSGKTSIFKGMPSSTGAGRSFTANLIIFDEWAFQLFAREIWASGFPTINRPSGGKVIGLSTIERGTLFEEIYTDPDNGFNKIFLPWYVDPRRTPEWYEKTKRALGDLIYAEYPATVDEALMVPGGAYFPEVKRDIHETDEEMTGYVKNYVSLDYGMDMLSAKWYHVDINGDAQAYRECRRPDLTISQAAQLLLMITGSEKIELWLAPPDLWNRRQETGKSVATIFSENSIDLTKVSNDVFNGCMSMKEWLRPRGTENEPIKPALTFLKDTCPSTIRCLQKIQKDKKNPNVYAKQPHELTHDVDCLRYFCVWWVRKPEQKPEKKKKRWRKDMWEDYKNANDADKRYLISIWGEPDYEG